MVKKRYADVLVVGAGPVGLFAALALTEAGFEVEIVDEDARVSVHSYALALHPRSLDLLERLGVAGALVEQGRTIESITFLEDGERRGTFPLTSSAAFPFVLSIPQSALEAVLEERLALRGVRVKWNQRVAALALGGQRAEARIEELEQVSGGYAIAGASRMVRRVRHVEARFVLGADGHASVVRQNLGASFPTVADAELFGVFEVARSNDAGKELVVILGEETVSALWPLPAGRARWSFQLQDAADLLASGLRPREVVQIGRRAFPKLAEEKLAALLVERVPSLAGRVEEVYWAMAVRFERRLSGSFGQGNVWLAGDAAHLTGPVGAQSMNVGLLEAYETVEQLSAAGHGAGALPSAREAALLARWQKLLLLDGEPESAAGAPPWVRRHGARIVSCLPASGDELTRLASAIGLRLA